jgi:hypothetical protein
VLRLAQRIEGSRGKIPGTNGLLMIAIHKKIVCLSPESEVIAFVEMIMVLTGSREPLATLYTQRE